MPLLRTAMYAKGIERYCAITVDDRETWIPTIRDIALEGRCFVLSARQFLQRSDLPPDYPTDRHPASPDVLIRGGSCVVGPLGQLLTGPKHGRNASLPPTLIVPNSPERSSISTWWVTIPVPTSSGSKSTNSR
jgi:nitrilase